MANSAEFEFPVGCLDAVERHRAVRVIPGPGQVFLVFPAAGVAALTIGQTAVLQHALGWAQRMARPS